VNKNHRAAEDTEKIKAKGKSTKSKDDIDEIMMDSSLLPFYFFLLCVSAVSFSSATEQP